LRKYLGGIKEIVPPKRKDLRSSFLSSER